MAAYSPQTSLRLASLASPLIRNDSVAIYDDKLHKEFMEDVNLSKRDHNSSFKSDNQRINSDLYCGLVRRKKLQQYAQTSPRHNRTSNNSCSLASSARSRVSSASTQESINSSRQLDPQACLKILKKSDTEFKELKLIYEDLLEAEINNSMDVEHFLREQEFIKLRRKEMLHCKWTEGVYDRIMRSIYDIVYQQNSPEARRRETLSAVTSDSMGTASSERLRNYQDYLSYVNKRGFTYLDTYQPSDYCTLQHTSPAETGRLRDPTLKQERDRLREKAIGLQCIFGSKLTDKEVEGINMPRVPESRADTTKWKNLSNLHFGDVDSASRCSSRLRMTGKRNTSTLDLTFQPAPPGNFRSVENPSNPSRDSVSVAVQTSE